MPVQAYPLFENAIRFARGETIDAHRERIAKLWSAFSRVAAENPFAWSRKSLSAEEVMTPSPTNRMIGYPYTKCMNSNWFLDQSAALIACSVETARSLGVPRDRWIFPHAGAGANDTEHLSNRLDLHSSPAIGLAGRRALELAGVELDSVSHIDLYSCFPSAVEISAAELGLDERRQLTVTGGLSFAGGPLNNYVMHSVATMMDVLRGDPGSLGLVTAVGGFLTNHAIGLYSSEPPREDYRHESVQAAVDALGRRELVEHHEGAVVIESYTVMHGREGPEAGLFACLTARRAPNVGQDDRAGPDEDRDRGGDVRPFGAHLERRRGRAHLSRRVRRREGQSPFVADLDLRQVLDAVASDGAAFVPGALDEPFRVALEDEVALGPGPPLPGAVRAGSPADRGIRPRGSVRGIPAGGRAVPGADSTRTRTRRRHPRAQDLGRERSRRGALPARLDRHHPAPRRRAVPRPRRGRDAVRRGRGVNLQGPVRKRDLGLRGRPG